MPLSPPTDENKVTTDSGHEVDQDNGDITTDIDGHIFVSVNNFYDDVFEARPWSSTAERTAKEARQGLNHQDFQSLEGFTAWLPEFQANLPAKTATRYGWINKQIGTSVSSRDVLVLSRLDDTGRELSWLDVLVVGRFCHDESYQTGFLELCGHARAVFASQPTRLFLHGFYISGGMMELWMFDRSGIYNYARIDIAAAFDRSLTVILGYMLMNDAELGVSTLIKEDTQGIYIACEASDTTEVEKLYLGEPPIFARVNKNIVRWAYMLPCKKTNFGMLGIRGQVQVVTTRYQY
jgi:hypothetical protein